MNVEFVYYKFWLNCKKASVKESHKTSTVYFIRSKWTSGLSWCEYTQ